MKFNFDRNLHVLALSTALVIYLIFIWISNSFYMMRIDDSFYYFKVAGNLLKDGKMTFDGVNLTNGVQPLWFIIVVIASRFSMWFGVIDNFAQIRIFSTVNAMCYLASAYLLYKLIRRYAGRKPALVVLWIWLFSPGLVTKMLGGMESPLYAFCIAATMLAYSNLNGESERNGPPNYKQLVILGAMLGTTFLARTDSCLLALIVGAALIYKKRSQGWREIGRVTLVPGATCLAVVCPYLIVNQLYFGHLMPVSGAAKLLESNVLFEQLGALGYASFSVRQGLVTAANLIGHLFGTFVSLRSWASGGMEALIAWLKNILKENTRVGNLVGAVLVLLALLVVGISLRYFISRLRYHPQAIQKVRGCLRSNWILLVFSSLQFFSYLALMPAQMHTAGVWWWLVPSYMSLAIIGGLGVWLVWQQLKVTFGSNVSFVASRWIAFLLAVVILPVWLWDAQKVGHSNEDAAVAMYEAAEWIDQNVPPDAVIGGWNAGILGYFCKHRITNLDGIVNSYDYLAYLERDQVACFIKKQGIQYLADNDKAQPITSSKWRNIPISGFVHRFRVGTIEFLIARIDLNRLDAWKCEPPNFGQSNKVRFDVP